MCCSPLSADFARQNSIYRPRVESSFPRPLRDGYAFCFEARLHLRAVVGHSVPNTIRMFTIMCTRFCLDEQEMKKTKAAARSQLVSGKRESFGDAVNTTLDDEQLSAAAVIDRLKEVLGADSDAELAWIFGTSPQSLSNRRARNSVPYREAIYVALWACVSLDYLLTGRGSSDVAQ